MSKVIVKFNGHTDCLTFGKQYNLVNKEAVYRDCYVILNDKDEEQEVHKDYCTIFLGVCDLKDVI